MGLVNSIGSFFQKITTGFIFGTNDTKITVKDNIIVEFEKATPGTVYEYSFPLQNGTIALTSDLTGFGLSNADITAVSLTTSTLTLTRASGNLTTSVPTFNQNTTGSAATLTTTRTIWGQNFNGSANITGAISAATTISMSGQLTNTVAIGTAPFVITSTTRVANLNVATAGTADVWTTARTITIGSTGKSVDGSANVSWTLSEIGAEAAFTTLGVAKGGTGASTLTGVLIGNGTSAVTAVAGTASQLLRRNAGNTAYEFFTQTLTTISDVIITSPTNGQLLQFNGTNWVNATISTGGVTGSGTVNYIPKFTTTTAIGNSLIFDNGTNVLINTITATGERFEVNGTARIAGAYLALNSTPNDAGKLRIFGSSSEYAIGTAGPITFGAINNNTVTNFTMPNNNAMGWRWSDSGHTASQGAMALSTNGFLSVASGIRVAYGESDTTVPTIPLDVNGNVAIQGQVYSPVNAKGNSGTGTVTFNWNDGNIQSVTLTGNCTFAFSNPQSGASYQIVIIQDGTGGRTITWPTIHWEGRTVPTLTGTLNSKDIVTLTYDGTNYNAVIAKNFGTP
jgi:hypothetical protein